MDREKKEKEIIFSHFRANHYTHNEIDRKRE